MANIWEHDFTPASGTKSHTMRLSATPEAVAELISAFDTDHRTTGRLADLRLGTRNETTHHLFLTGSWPAPTMPVFVKLNLSPWEMYWMLALSEHASDLVPHVFASGDRLGHHQVRWLVLEQVPYQLLDSAWGDRRFDMLAAAAVQFQVAAQSIDRRYTGIESLDTTQRWLELDLSKGCPGPLIRALDRLERDWDWVMTMCGLEVCFGDLHASNALCRTPPPNGDHALLIDPIPRIAPWAWDAAYCQVISAISDIRMVHRMAAIRQQRGLPVPDEPDLDRLATILLAWLSALWWGIAPGRHEDLAWRDQLQRYVEELALL